MDFINVVGVQFRRAGRIYDFLAGQFELKVGDDVVVETDRGPSLAKVASIKFSQRKNYDGLQLKPILRRARKKDISQTGKLTPERAVTFTREKVESLKLKMSVLQADVQFGGNKVIIYFTAPGRVDFRTLVKELATGLKSRVELKQVGARDETKLIGGLGVCGREFCCSSFLREFVPVSIKMAKNQNLALNPTKVSGGCGRLLCCLTYENDMYADLRKKLPPKGVQVRLLNEGVTGHVLKGDLLNQALLVETGQGQQLTVKIADIEIIGATETPDVESEAESWGEDLDLNMLLGGEEGEKPAGAPVQKPEEQQKNASGPGRTQTQQGKPTGKKGKRPRSGRKKSKNRG